MSTVQLHHGDALAVLRTLSDASIDAIVCDPPYALAEHKPATIAAAMTAWCTGDREHVPDGKGFMGKDWDGFVPPPAVWDECLRVLKPGGHLLCFAGTRTVDLMGLSVRLAGFEIRDTITWHYGSGFPKSLDVSKAIDKARDDRSDIVRVTSYLADHADARGVSRGDVDAYMGTGDMGGWWLSRLTHRCQVPRWEQWLKLRELLGFGDEMDDEVWRLNGRKGTPGEAWGQREIVGTIRNNQPGGTSAFEQGGIGEYVRGDTRERDIVSGEGATDAARQWQGWGTALKPASEPIIVARKPLGGTVAACVLVHGTGALNIDACRVATDEPIASHHGTRNPRTAMGNGWHDSYQPGDAGKIVQTAGRWPANVVLSHAPDCGDPCVDGCPVAELDAQSGTLTSGKMQPTRPKGGNRNTYGQDAAAGYITMETYGDSGGASRFFPTFRYQAKAPTRERPKVDGVAHPTVKPLALMAWLVRLVCPPGGTVLDHFAGSGTTGEACVAEGFDVILIEREPTYLPLITHRLGVELEQVLAPAIEAPAEPEPELEPVDELLAAIEAAGDRAALAALFAEHGPRWTAEHRAAADAVWTREAS